VRGTGPVLVVDDDPDLRGVLRELLEREGHPVVEAADGRRALTAAAAHEPALILLDARMPGMDAVAFVAAYRSGRTHPAPIVMMTGRVDATAVARAAGADALLTKPFGVDEVVALVQRLA